MFARPTHARSLFVTLILLAALDAAATSRPDASPGTPKLALIVAIDGLSWERLDSFRPYFEDGFKRLLDEGRVESACRYRHLNTETGPGHSSLGAGAPPRVTGIVANRWFEARPDGGLRSVSCAQQWDPAPVPGKPPLFYREVARDGRLYVFALSGEWERWQQSGEIGLASTRPNAGPDGETLVFDSPDAIRLFNWRHGRPEETFPPAATITGPGNLRVPTLADRLVEARPGARVVALSAKDRSAVFLAGRDARHAVYWYDRDTGRFVTSPAYDVNRGAGPTAAAVVREFNRTQAGARLVSRFGLTWSPSPPPPAGPALPVAPRDLFDYQLPAQGIGFPHDLSRDPAGYSAGFYVSPFIDELLADLALALLESEALALGRRAQPDLLLLSFSAQDLVSHSYGNESDENVDTLRRLDRQLGRLLRALERHVGREHVALALSSDHGFAAIPEVHRRDHPGASAGRLVNSERAVPNFVERLNRLLVDELCLPVGTRAIFGVEGWSLTYNRPAFPLRRVEGPCGPADARLEVGVLDEVLPRVITRHFAEELESVLPVALRDTWPRTRAAEFALNDLDPERSGDAFLVPRENVLMHWDPARGAGHGSHYDYDAHVPLVFWGGRFPAGSVSDDSTPHDVAPTLADLLGVALPDAVGVSRLRPEASSTLRPQSPRSRERRSEAAASAAGTR